MLTTHHQLMPALDSTSEGSVRLQRADDATPRVSIKDECLTAFNEFRMSHGKTKFIIFKVADNKKEIVLDDVSQDQDYEAFRSKLGDARDDKGNPAPRYAVYDVEYELPGEGKRYGPSSWMCRMARLTDCPLGARSSSSPGFPMKPPPSYVYVLSGPVLITNPASGP